MTHNIAWFIKLTNQARQIMNSDANWETKYSLIFSNFMSNEITMTGIDFDWYDPDMGYEDDVRAYVNALTDKAQELMKVMS
jgi:hypothetical protein